jgi:RHH-type proline utilization regulon transcriptional repressor/proline dehydrogenase/delta 1-pyrroline-5-carboxylate dehydrogenase
VRTGVKRGSEYHKTEYFGPILGIMTADTLEEAVSMVNDIDYGLTSGLHSLDPKELKYWLDNVQAGNLYINRGITGAIVRRQPFGGWKKSAVGAGTKAGGPNYLVGLGEWKDAPIEATQTATLAAPARQILAAAADTVSTGSITAADLGWLESALASDAVAWETEFGAARDVSGLHAERNIFRYRPLPVTIRYEEATSGHGLAELLRVASAGVTAWNGRPEVDALTVSTPQPLPDAAARALRDSGVVMVVENSAAWAARVTQYAAKTGPESGVRLRLIGAPALHTAEAANGKPDVAIYSNDVVAAGRVELLPFLQEQAVSITAHRFGTPNNLTGALI